MNLNKHLDFIQPSNYIKPIHIIGVGAVGSRMAEILVRLGFSNINIYDFDIVEDVNVTNQLYTAYDVGQLKIDALERHLKQINPLVVISKQERYTNQKLDGAVFLCVDSIVLRREIVTSSLRNNKIDVMFDMRMRLTDAQGYAAIWEDKNQVETLLNSMSFNDEDDLTPVSVCGTSLNVAPTVLTLISAQIMNFISYIKTRQLKQVIFLDVAEFSLSAFSYK